MKNTRKISLFTLASSCCKAGWRIARCALVFIFLAACGQSFYSPANLSDADLLRIAVEIGHCEQAAARWMTDMGGLRPLSAKGEFSQSHMPQFERQLMHKGGTGGKWDNWKGPYLTSFIFREYWPRTTFACRLGGQEYQLDPAGTTQNPHWILELSICDVSAMQWQQLKKLLEPGIADPDSNQSTKGCVHWRPDVLSILVAYEQ